MLSDDIYSLLLNLSFGLAKEMTLNKLYINVKAIIPIDVCLPFIFTKLETKWFHQLLLHCFQTSTRPFFTRKKHLIYPQFICFPKGECSVTFLHRSPHSAAFGISDENSTATKPTLQPLLGDVDTMSRSFQLLRLPCMQGGWQCTRSWEGAHPGWLTQTDQGTFHALSTELLGVTWIWFLPDLWNSHPQSFTRSHPQQAFDPRQDFSNS